MRTLSQAVVLMIELNIRQKCRHGYAHPHSVTVFDSDSSDDMLRWCTEGDTVTLNADELRRVLFHVLAEQDPRMPIEDALEKARQVTDDLTDRLRKGDVIPRG